MSFKRKPIVDNTPDELVETMIRLGVPPGRPKSFYYRVAFAKRLPFGIVGKTRAQLLYGIADLLIPGYFEKHAWTNKVVESICENKWVAFTGCGSSAKTHNVAGVAVTWWLASPSESSVIICSTTREMLKKRGWAQIQDCFSRYPTPKFGNFVDSHLIWQARPGDNKHAISGKAVEEGSVNKIADDIKGIHTPRQMVIVDEATGVREAIYAACSNLYMGATNEFIMVVIGNMISWTDAMGRFCTPANGIGSVTVEDEEWHTAPQLDGTPGLVVHFDGFKSPNITEGRIVSKYLPTKEKIEAATARAGSDSDPLVWANVRGFPPPEGILRTIFSEPMLINGQAFDPGEPFVGGDVTIHGGFDPAYSIGGDIAAIRFARCGKIEDGSTIIQLFPPMIVPLSATSPDKITYQLARGARKLCEQYKCPSENLAVDASAQPGVCDIMEQEWGPVIRVSGSESASSDRTVSYEDKRICKDVYKTKSTELWFTGARFIDAKQIRNLDAETANEMCKRLYEGGSDGQKLQIEPKIKFKRRMSHSPDRSDSLFVLLEGMRMRGIQIQKLGRTAKVDTVQKKVVDAYNEIYETADYTTEEEPEEEFTVV